MANNDRANRRDAIAEVIGRFLDDREFRRTVRQSDNPVRTLERELQRQANIRFSDDERAFLKMIDWNRRPRDIRAGFRFSQYALFW